MKRTTMPKIPAANPSTLLSGQRVASAASTLDDSCRDCGRHLHCRYCHTVLRVRRNRPHSWKLRHGCRSASDGTSNFTERGCHVGRTDVPDVRNLVLESTIEAT